MSEIAPAAESDEAALASGPLTLRSAHWLQRHAGLILGLLIAVTSAMAIPFLLMPPTSTASQEPAGKVFSARDLAADRFASQAYRMVFIVEAKGSNILASEPLLELKQNCRALLADSHVGPKLLTFPHPRLGIPVKGMLTIADVLQPQLEAIQRHPSPASEANFFKSLAQVLDTAGPSALGLSVKARRDPQNGRWESPALIVPVMADNTALGGGGATTTLGTGSTHKESFAREVQRLLRGKQQHIQVWGLAIDVNLTSAEQGRAAGPFIGLTLFAILLLVGIIHRSYWSVAVIGFCLGCLIIWLKGLTNLMGFKHDQILNTIVPVAMISFGVDFAIHSIGRYREEILGGTLPRRAFTLGLGGGMTALLLAMATDVVAFLSNASSGIESLIQFGVAAAVATVASFLMLGIFAPLLVMKIEEHGGFKWPARTGLVLGTGGSLLASLAAMAVVILSLFILPWAGVAALAGYGLLFLIFPHLILPRSKSSVLAAPRVKKAEGLWIGALMERLTRRRWVLLPAVLLLTSISTYFATRVEPVFDVKDFFAADTDFVVALDKFDTHVGKQGGEPAIIFVEGPLLGSRALKHLRQFSREIRALKTQQLARDADGEIQLSTGLLAVLDLASKKPAFLKSFTKATGIKWNPHAQLEAPLATAALIRFAREQGIKDPGGNLLMSADHVSTLYWESAGGARQATQLTLRIPGSRSQENIRGVRRDLDPIVQRLEHKLQQIDSSATATLTGQPITRQTSLDAILRAFRLSLPVAILLCFTLAIIFMGSFRFALVSILPILMVVSWLYAIMYLGGYGINVVTATIGAISIGQGIDYAVHLTMRFREELRAGRCRAEAMRQTGAGTGSALWASAFSSIVGFSILAFSPMPMFASYGLLTAIMVILAAVASLLVLPSLLMIAAHKK